MGRKHKTKGYVYKPIFLERMSEYKLKYTKFGKNFRKKLIEELQSDKWCKVKYDKFYEDLQQDLFFKKVKDKLYLKMGQYQYDTEDDNSVIYTFEYKGINYMGITAFDGMTPMKEEIEHYTSLIDNKKNKSIYGNIIDIYPDNFIADYEIAI